MSLRAQILIPVFLVATVAILVGLLWRRRLGSCASFTLYLCTVATCEGLTFFWPSRFWVYPFYVEKEILAALLKLAIVVELSHRVLRLFPGAAARATIVSGPLLAVLLLLLFRLAAGDAQTFLTLAQLQTGTTWALLFLALAVAYYNLPLEPFHRAIIGGLATYTAIAGPLMSVMHLYRVELSRETVSAINAFAWTGLMLFWVRAAWRHEAEPALSAEAVARLRAMTAAP